MATMKKAQSGAKTTKKPKTVSQRIGDLTLRDVKNSAETATNILTLGGYGLAKKGIKKLTGLKTGGTMKKAKSGGSFGALSVKAGVDNNYGITAADRISGAKMNKGKAKSGTKMKKAGTHKMPDGSMMKNSAMKSGGKMKKCKYGCN